jgi:hypothetical protein
MLDFFFGRSFFSPSALSACSCFFGFSFAKSLDAGFAAPAGLSAVLAAGALATVLSAFAALLSAFAALLSAFAGASVFAGVSAFAGALAFAALEENLPRTIACAASSIPLEADFTG